nr:cyclin-dependent kinase-like 5 [Labrus bergylta]
MERYESLGLVGEGSYGTVLKCRHRESGRLVAIKKFMDSDDDKTVKKIALREIKLLRQLRHDNLVNLLEVWKRRRRWYLVFEFVERTLLDDLEKNPNGLDLNTSRQYLYQILRAVAFCHQQNIIHRDIKPENILISQGDLIKLCDFGFARTMTMPTDGGVYTDYVATRWYRAPELLVGDTKYGKPVDVWAVGCLLLEMLTGQPLFPGDSDLDQIFHIVRCFGNLTAHHQELFYRNPVFSGVRLPQCSGRVPLEQRFPLIATNALDIAQNCLQMDPESRAHCSELLDHPLFTQDSFNIRFLDELNAKIQKDHRENSTLPIIGKTQRREKDEIHGKNQRRKDKKQSEDSEEKFNMEKEKRDKGDRDDKLPKTKAKQPSKPKHIHNTSEPLMSTKTSGAKTFDNAAKITKVDHGQTAMRSKLGKAIGVEFRKEPEICKPTKTRTSDSLEASKTATDLNKQVDTKPKHVKVSSLGPRDGHLKQVETKTTNSTSLHSGCSDNNVLSSSQDFRKSKNNSNTRVLKLPKSLTTDLPTKSSSPKSSLKATIYRTDTDLTQRKGPETATTCEMSNSGQVQTNFSMKVVEVTTRTIPSVPKPCKTTTSSNHLTDCSNMDTEQRLTSKCPKVLPSATKPSKTSSKSGPRIAKENTSLSNSPSESFTSDLSAQSSTVFIGGSLPNGTILPKANLQIGPSLDTKPSNDTPCLPNKPSTELQTNKDLGEVLIATTTQQYSCYMSKEDIEENNGRFTRSPVTKTAEKHIETLDVLSEDYQENPEYDEARSINQQGSSKSNITKESRSSFSLNEIPKTKTLLATIVPKTFKVSDKENSEELALSASNSPSTKSFIDQIPKVARSPHFEQTEPNVKSLRPLHSESLIGGSKSKIGSFSNPTKSPTTMAPKTQINMPPRNKRGISERNDPMNASTTSESTSLTSTATPDRDASTRIFHNMYTIDVNKFNFNVSHSSPPPPPPPPSSTPQLLPPSSTPLIPSISIVSAPNTAASNHFTLGAGFHSGTNNLRCTDKPRHQSSIYSRLTQQSLSSHIPGSLTYQIPEKGQIYEHNFLSDHCNPGNSGGGNTLTKKKPDIHFPDLRSSVPPEHKGREGKQPNKGTSKEQRKDKQPVQAIPPSDQQKLVNNGTDTHPNRDNV